MCVHICMYYGGVYMSICMYGGACVPEYTYVRMCVYVCM